VANRNQFVLHKNLQRHEFQMQWTRDQRNKMLHDRNCKGSRAILNNRYILTILVQQE
jgi:hypothetical protein